MGPIAHRDLVHTHVPKLRVGVALYTDPLRGPDGGCHYPERARAVSLSHGHVIQFNIQLAGLQGEGLSASVLT